MPVDTAPQQQRLEMRWVPVTDSRGRERLEAVWLTPAQVTSLAPTHAA